MTLESILTMLGGIGMFLYGMKLMGNSLERAAGARMEKILEKLTSNKAKGVALGAGVTAVIQSSAATIIMVIGFLNAGILKLAQGVPVIMGANIGTTITAQILRMGDIDGDSIILMLLKPSSFAPILIIIGAFVLLMTKKQSLKDKMGILIGLGILFMGMTLMEGSFAPLSESEEFGKIFTLFENPFLGVLVGMAVTILLQSSSASVGVLQATSSTGVVTFSMAAPIVIGANLGKCVTVLLASIGVNKDAKRAVAVDVTMCITGSILFLLVIYLYQGLFGFSFWSDSVNRGGVANFHTLFNVIVCIVMLPMINVLIAISKKLVKDKGQSKMDEELSLLDPRFLETPNIALEQCKKVVAFMCETGKENFNIACDLVHHYNDDARETLEENEKFLDKTEAVLGEYIVQVTERQLTPKQNLFATELLHTIGDLERIGDHCVNLAEEAELAHLDKIKYSDESMREFSYLKKAINTILDMTKEAYEMENITVGLRVSTLEETIDDLIDTLKSNHIKRLRDGVCTIDRGVSYIEMLTDIERISDHCNNISTHLIQRINDKDLNTHTRKDEEEMHTEEFKGLCRYYDDQFLDPVKEMRVL